jgi:hypothetical protein
VTKKTFYLSVYTKEDVKIRIMQQKELGCHLNVATRAHRMPFEYVL